MNIDWFLDHVKSAFENKTVAKILWDSRSIHRNDWKQLKKFFKDHPEIKNVLEYGAGLSTELMELEGLKVTSLETDQEWAEMVGNVTGCNVINYQENHPPKLEGKFDFALVDGPQTKRTATILHAKEYTDIIYLHDLRPEEVKLLDDWYTGEKYGQRFFFRVRSASVR